jgi:glutathione peroxidase-family protein
VAMFPHERSLVKRFEGKPFTIIGVNSDKYDDEFKKNLEKHQVTWRSFKNERGEAGPIATEWNIRGWPTLYLIDHKGVIHKKWVGSPGDKVMDEEIEKLVKIAEEANKSSE